MGFTYDVGSITQTLLNLLLMISVHIRAIFMALLSKAFSITDRKSEDEEEDRPSPSLVPVPVHFTTGVSIKQQLLVAEFGNFLHRRRGEKTVCIVCMNCMEPKQEMRELCNCCHVFHRDCLDAWIDEGQVTCPLCRSKLLPELREEDQIRKGEDPWRRERMLYLFGEDIFP